jgi:hypothetical protein
VALDNKFSSYFSGPYSSISFSHFPEKTYFVVAFFGATFLRLYEIDDS